MRSTLSMVNDTKRTVHSAFDGLAMEDLEGAVVRSRVVKSAGSRAGVRTNVSSRAQKSGLKPEFVIVFEGGGLFSGRGSAPGAPRLHDVRAPMPGTAIEHRQQAQISLCAFSSLLFYIVEGHHIPASRVVVHRACTKLGRLVSNQSPTHRSRQDSPLCSRKTNGCISMLEASRHTL